MIRIDNKPKCSPARYKPWLVVFLAVFVVVLLFPLLVKLVFLDIPRPSTDFDCDDAAFFAMQRLSAIGIPSTPIIGNLKVTGESYQKSDHIWLLVDIAGLHIPVDWGQFHLGSQYYEGYILNLPQLLAFVEQDSVAPAIPTSAEVR